MLTSKNPKTADQKLPHFIPRTQTRNRSPRCNNLQGLVLPLQMLWLPPPAALLGMQATASCGSSSEDAGHIQEWQCLWDGGAQPPLQLAELLQQPSEMAGRKQCSACAPGSSPWAAAVCNSSSRLPFFFLHERTRNYGDNFVPFPLRCKSGLKTAKRKFSQLEKEFVKL